MLSLQVKSFSRNPMAKKSMVEREKKRARLRQKYEAKRAELKEQFRTAEDFEEKLAIQGSAEKVFRGDRVWGVGCGVWGFTGFEVANYLIFREKVQGFSP